MPVSLIYRILSITAYDEDGVPVPAPAINGAPSAAAATDGSASDACHW